eukprot:m.62926 g.62926  ORF g.62926 m.62926 type:complete len:114 (-) comp49604_c0_seq5:595-936(-)
MLPGTVVLLLAFFAILHSWLNAFAELLCFADRQFYKDWWNARSFAAYYRTWNCVVHDWLYSYIYCELMSVSLSFCALIPVFTSAFSVCILCLFLVFLSLVFSVCVLLSVLQMF